MLKSFLMEVPRCRSDSTEAKCDVIRRLDLQLDDLVLTLIAQTPILDIVRLIAASVLAAKVGPVRISGGVAVLDPGERLLERAGACIASAVPLDSPVLPTHVKTDERLPLVGTAHVHELVRAKAIVLCREPRELNALRSLVDGTDAVLPVVV